MRHGAAREYLPDAPRQQGSSSRTFGISLWNLTLQQLSALASGGCVPATQQTAAMDLDFSEASDEKDPRSKTFQIN
jgi:hypothetical protein